MTLNQINSNPLCAPIGEETLFKKRIFFDNLSKCMTIRQFQKTAGIEIKKAITGIHPTAKIMNQFINIVKDRYFLEDTDNFSREAFIKLNINTDYAERTLNLKYIKKLYTFKNGKTIKCRLERVKMLIHWWDYENNLYYKNSKKDKYEAYLRLGFYKYLDYNEEFIKTDYGFRIAGSLTSI